MNITNTLEKLAYNVVYTIALVYFLGYFLRELLPHNLTNAKLASPFVFVGGKLRAAAFYSVITLSSFVNLLISGFTPLKAGQLAIKLTPCYVTMWRQ